jgi:FkbM family methyltransferase
MMYSQNDEESVIVPFFHEKQYPKRFLDIGAHDGVTFSNTRRLSELGWGGTLVEPSSAAFTGLMKNHLDRPDVNLVNAAIVVSPTPLMKFHDSQGDMVSTFDEAHRALWSKARPFQTVYVSPITTAQLLDAMPGPYSFINLDVEGLNLEVFCEIPLRRLETMLVCVEYANQYKEVEQFAGQQGYKCCHKTSENAIFVAV